MENQLKVAVELHEGEKSTKKIWRFNADLAAEYWFIPTAHATALTGPRHTPLQLKPIITRVYENSTGKVSIPPHSEEKYGW